MAISDVIEKLGRAIFESPFSATRLTAEVPELAEVRLVVLETVKSRSHRISGKMVFPYNLIRIRLSGVPEQQASAFQGDFLARYFDEELKGGLERSSFRYPDDLRVEIQTTPELPKAKESWIRVDTEAIAKPPAAELPGFSGRAVLTAMQGTANFPEFEINKVRVNIGRTVDVFRSAGPSRRNDLAFAEDTEVNRSVSREHAHLTRDRNTGEIRIFNDRWYKTAANAEENCGLWIVRDGMSQPVHRNSRGVALRDGDEVHLGQAVLLFRLEPAGA